MPVKVYKCAPLPFMGQKRRFASEFGRALANFSSSTTFVDLFGGSGLLSHITKCTRPDAHVVYNDFDDYHLRIKDIDRTNSIVAHIRNELQVIPKAAKVPTDLHDRIVEILSRHEEDGAIDYITISSSILFSGSYATDLAAIRKETFYNNVKKDVYLCHGYLDGLDIVKCDYRDLFNKYKNTPNVVFIVDPPYLATDVGTYKMYWRLKDYLDVLKVLEGTSYFYFTSNKSSIIELTEWMAAESGRESPFTGAIRRDNYVTLNYHSKYTDIMFYKKQ